MAKPLPFVVTPQPYELVEVGNDTCGKLAIKKIGSLAPNEQEFIKRLSADLPDLKRDAVRLAQRIAKEQSFSAVDVHSALIQGNTELLSDYLEEVLDFQAAINLVANQREQILATCILRFRVDPEWELADTGNADLISPELVREVALFATREENGWVTEEETPPETEQPLTEEDLGKSSNPKSSRNGQKSSGESTAIGAA